MIQSLHVFSELDQKLIEVLQSLEPEDWERPTIARKWTVKDVASHILDGTLRGISQSRDAYFGSSTPQINSYQDLLDFLNTLNADWVKATQRLSPELLIHLLSICSPLYLSHLEELDLQGEALFSVAWAGEDSSKAWFHIAREYTEKFHHQQQIRLAVGKDHELLKERLYLPYLDTSMRALPHHYRETDAPDGTVLKFTVSDISKSWFLLRTGKNWALTNQAVDHTDRMDTEVLIPKEIAWRLLSKGITYADAKSQIKIHGHMDLGEKILSMVAVMA